MELRDVTWYVINFRLRFLKKWRMVEKELICSRVLRRMDRGVRGFRMAELHLCESVPSGKRRNA